MCIKKLLIGFPWNCMAPAQIRAGSEEALIASPESLHQIAPGQKKEIDVEAGTAQLDSMNTRREASNRGLN
jgi:hypothetical protein